MNTTIIIKNRTRQKQNRVEEKIYFYISCILQIQIQKEIVRKKGIKYIMQ